MDHIACVVACNPISRDTIFTWERVNKRNCTNESFASNNYNSSLADLKRIYLILSFATHPSNFLKYRRCTSTLRSCFESMAKVNVIIQFEGQFYRSFAQIHVDDPLEYRCGKNSTLRLLRRSPLARYLHPVETTRLNETRSLSADERWIVGELAGMSYLTERIRSYSPASMRNCVSDILRNEASRLVGNFR